MPNFAGTWKMRSSENFDELLKALGEARGRRAAGCGPREGTRGGSCSRAPVSPGRAPCVGRGQERLPPVRGTAQIPTRGWIDGRGTARSPPHLRVPAVLPGEPGCRWPGVLPRGSLREPACAGCAEPAGAPAPERRSCAVGQQGPGFSPHSPI